MDSISMATRPFSIITEFWIMKKSILALGFLACSTLTFAQAPTDAVQTVELKDGGRVVIMKN